MFRIVITVIILLMAQMCMAATIHVPADSATIQAGINGAVTGDTVLVALGLYIGPGNRDMSYNGKDIVVISENGPDVTSIVPQGSPTEPHRAFNFLNNETSAAELVGFTIMNGYGTYSHGEYEGGAMLIENSSPTIKYCVFANNMAGNQGGAVSCFTSSPNFQNCTFVNNTATYGVGIYSNGASPVLENCIIAFGNSGSAAYCNHGAAVELICCDLYGNAGGDYFDCAEGQWGVNGNISEDPEFTDTSENDYSIAYYSPCSPHVNLDCGLIGALWPPDYEFPVALYINYGPTADGNIVPTLTPEFFWTYYDTAPTMQTAYELEVGTDIDWSVAEMWSTGEVTSSETNVLYAGSQLSDNTTFYLRVRVSNGRGWGDWRQKWFSIRTPNILYVPSQYSTIQSAVDMATDFDTVLVAPGIYTGPGNRDIDFEGRRILLVSEEGPEETSIDCQGTEIEPHRAFSFTSGEDSSAIVEGFSVVNGYGPDEIAGNIGGAVYCLQSSPTFIDCIFSGNIGNDFGGAIASFISSPRFINCSFDSNYANYGGAIYLVGSAPSNDKQIYSPLFDNCDFSGNSANLSNGYGGAIYCHLGDIQLTMTHCLAYDNTAAYGGGLAAASISTADLINCTFAYNSAPMGAGLFLDGSTTANLQNNIIAFNEQGEGIFCDDLVYLEQLTCNDIYGNAGGDTVLCILPQTEVYGNFSLDPLFCDPENGNFGVDHDSPCRWQLNECGVSIGSEAPACGFLFICGDANSDQTTNVSDAVHIIGYVFVGACAPDPLESGDANCDYVVNVSDAVWIINYVFIGGNIPCDVDGDQILDCYVR